MAKVLASLIVKIGADIKDYSDGLKQATSQLAKVSRTMVDAGRNMTAAITLPMVGLGMAAVNVAGKFEQTQIAFTHFLGSSQAAKAYLGDLYKFAATTPFEIESVTKGAQSLMAMGFAAQDVVPDLRILGDQLSAVGRTENMQNLILAFGQMKAKGTASMEEIRQMMESGVVPAVKYLAEGLGKSETEIFDMLKKKAIDSGTAIKLILAGMERDTGGLMSEQMESFSAQLSNLKDKITLALKDIGNSLLPLAKDLLELGAGAADSLAGIAHAFAGLSAPMQGMIIAVAGLTAAAGPAFLILGSFANAARSIMSVWPMVRTALSYGATAFAALASPVGIAVAAVAAVVAGLYIFRDAAFSLMGSTYQLQDVWNAAWIAIKNVVHDTVVFFGGAISMIRGAWSGLTSWMSSLWNGAFGTIGEKMKAVVLGLLGWAKSVMGSFVPDFVIKALDEAKRNREEAAKAAAAEAAEEKKQAAQREADAARRKALQQQELDQLKKLGAESGSQFKQFWTGADRAAFAMRQLVQITADAVNQPFRRLAQFFSDFIDSAPEFASESLKAAEAVGEIGAAMDPLADVMAEVTKQVNSWSDAFATLGITSSATLAKQAADAEAAYEVIRDSGASTAHDIEVAWVAMEKARQAAAIASGEVITDAERKELANRQAALNGNLKTQATAWSTFGQQVSTIMTDLSRDLADALFGSGSFGEKMKSALVDIGKAFTRVFLEEAARAVKTFVQTHMASLLSSLKEALSQIPALGKALSSVFGVGSSAAGSAAGAGGSAAGAGGGIAAAVGGGISGIVGAVGSVVGAISGVIGNFQMHGMNKTLDLIEESTRYTKITLQGAGGVNDTLRTYLPLLSWLPKIDDDLNTFSPSAMVAHVSSGGAAGLGLSSIPSGGSNATGPMNITIHVHADRNPDATAKNLMRRLKTLSPKFSPAS
jgi:tape measure domain-containing protein